jgi:hypothetical protein
MKSQVNYSLIVLSTCFLWLSCDTESNVDPVYKDSFIKYYGIDGDQEGRDFVINNDETMVILGTSTQNARKRLYLAKIDFDGVILWERSLGDIDRDEVALDIEPIAAGPDAGKFAVLSNVTKNLVDSIAIRLTIISQDGDSLKSILFNQLESQKARSVTPLSDGGYFVTGKTTDTDADLNAALLIPDEEDILIIRFDNNLLNPQFDRIGSSSIGSGIKIFENSSGFYYAGYSNEWNTLITDNVYDLNFTLRSFTPLGPPSGTPTAYSGTGATVDHEEMTFITKSISSDFYLAVGTQTLSGSGDKRLWTCAINTDFSFGREKDIENDVEGVAVGPSSDGQFLVVGNKINAGVRDIWLGKVSNTLGLQFLGTFGGSNNDDTASAVAELPNGDIVVLGTMELTNQKKIALIKLKANGDF